MKNIDMGNFWNQVFQINGYKRSPVVILTCLILCLFRDNCMNRNHLMYWRKINNKPQFSLNFVLVLAFVLVFLFDFCYYFCYYFFFCFCSLKTSISKLKIVSSASFILTHLRPITITIELNLFDMKLTN